MQHKQKDTQKRTTYIPRLVLHPFILIEALTLLPSEVVVLNLAVVWNLPSEELLVNPC